LLHEVKALGPANYGIRLTGPVSVLHATRRYGVNFARLLPGLLSCRQWRMHAKLNFGRLCAFFRLDSASGLRGHHPEGKLFDSSLEENFARKFGEERQGWKLEREADILVKGQKVFVPDFVFRHRDGRKVFFEIVGFWTPEYLQAKWKTLSLFREQPILVSVSKRDALAGAAEIPKDVLTHSEALQVRPILKRLEQFRDTCHPGEVLTHSLSIIPQQVAEKAREKANT